MPRRRLSAHVQSPVGRRSGNSRPRTVSEDDDRLDCLPALRVFKALVDVIEGIVTDEFFEGEPAVFPELDQPGNEDLRHRAARTTVLKVQPFTRDAPISKLTSVPGLAAPTRARGAAHSQGIGRLAKERGQARGVHDVVHAFVSRDFTKPPGDVFGL